MTFPLKVFDTFWDLKALWHVKSFIESKMFKMHRNLRDPLQNIIKHKYCVTINNIKTLKISTSNPMMSSAIWQIFFEFLIFCDFFHEPLGIRSSHPEVFYKKDVLRNFAECTGKHLCQSLFFNKVAGLSNMTYFQYLPYFLQLLSTCQHTLHFCCLIIILVLIYIYFALCKMDVAHL